MTRLHKVLQFLGIAFVLVLAFGIGAIYNERVWRMDMVRKQATLLYRAVQRHDTQAIQELASPKVAHWLAAQDALMGPVREFRVDNGYAEVAGIPAGVLVTVKRTKGEQVEDISDWSNEIGINQAGLGGAFETNSPCPSSGRCDWPGDQP